ncbi:MAG: pyruvate formate lyase-activating protein [Clostridia bacterium]|nr:pyruvate formate lyase-activating protein [Clostridia bacterium]
MTNNVLTGRVHSIQSMGTLDGPGVRYVVFLQGCPLRCGCCHNPDTWSIEGGTVYTADEIIQKAIRFKEYFGKEGGVTVSGGEPLLQSKFVKELFELCHKNGINTCLDTSGYILDDQVKALLSVTDRVLLDVKYTDDASYRENVGCPIKSPLAFLDYLQDQGIPTTLRQVIIPTKNDSKENIFALKEIANAHGNVDKIELLPFRKICQVKYDKMGIPFRFGEIPEPTKDKMREFEELLDE